MNDIILAFISAFFLTYAVIPSIITIAKIKRLYDAPDERRAHTEIIPTLGGVAIFAGLVFALTFWTPFYEFKHMQYVLCALIIIFLIGAKDDIIPLTPGKKFMGQIAAATILVYKGGVILTSLHGMFGVHDIPDQIAVPLSIFTILVIVNAFNLIDGVNGLAGSIGIVICLTFGAWFYLVDRMDMAVISFSLCGAIGAFLKFNFSPAKIFMGDTGSLLIGLVAAILAVRFIEANKDLTHTLSIDSVPAVAMGVLVIPLFDTLRVFTLRFMKGKSPFQPDKTHLHHMLLELGLSHMQTTLTLVVINVFFVFIAFTLSSSLNTLFLLILIFVLAMMLSGALSMLVKKRRANPSVL